MNSMTPDKVTAETIRFPDHAPMLQIENVDGERAAFGHRAIANPTGVQVPFQVPNFVQQNPCKRDCVVGGCWRDVQWLPADETLAGVDACANMRWQRRIYHNGARVATDPCAHWFADEGMLPRIVINHVDDGLEFRWVGEPRRTRCGRTCAGGEECGAQCKQATHDE